MRITKYIKQWYLFYSGHESIGQQLVGQLKKSRVLKLVTQIPWGHNLVIISRIKDANVALFYVQKIIQNNWSRAVLIHQIESGLYGRTGNAVKIKRGAC